MKTHATFNEHWPVVTAVFFFRLHFSTIYDFSLPSSITLDAQHLHNFSLTLQLHPPLNNVCDDKKLNQNVFEHRLLIKNSKESAPNNDCHLFLLNAQRENDTQQ